MNFQFFILNVCKSIFFKKMLRKIVSLHGMHIYRSQTRCLPTLRERARLPDPNDLYEPRFEVKRKYPDIELVNVKMQAFDYQPLEKFQSYVHWAAKHFLIDVIECYALSHTAERIKEYKPNSILALTEYTLKTYKRVVRLGPVPAMQLQLLTILLQTHAPVGVSVTVKVHDAEDEDERYIPDPQLEDFKETLRNLDDPVVRKYLGWEA